MRETFNVSKPSFELRQDIQHPIDFMFRAESLRNLARILVRTTHKTDRP